MGAIGAQPGKCINQDKAPCGIYYRIHAAGSGPETIPALLNRFCSLKRSRTRPKRRQSLRMRQRLKKQEIAKKLTMTSESYPLKSLPSF